MRDETTYEICLEDALDEKWSRYFRPFKVISEANMTRLVGPVHDQAELFGVLLKIRDLGLGLISVNPLPE